MENNGAGAYHGLLADCHTGEHDGAKSDMRKPPDVHAVAEDRAG